MIDLDKLQAVTDDLRDLRDSDMSTVTNPGELVAIIETATRCETAARGVKCASMIGLGEILRDRAERTKG